MFTRNYSVLRNTIDCIDGSGGNVTTRYAYKDITGTERQTANLQNSYHRELFGFKGTGTTGTILVVGTGTAAESINDYCLGNDITSNITNFSVSYNSAIDVQDDKVCNVITYTCQGTNQTGSTFNISEVGVVRYMQYSSSSLCQVLLARKVITPVVVEDGQSFTIVLKIYDF